MTPVVRLAVVMMLFSAAMLVVGLGASTLWIAVVTVGIGMVAIDRMRGRHSVQT